MIRSCNCNSFKPYFSSVIRNYSWTLRRNEYFSKPSTLATEKTRWSRTSKKLETNKKKKWSRSRLGYDKILKNFHEEREGLRLLRLHSTPDHEDRSLLFAIVSTGHCIRVEGSRSRIEVAAEVLRVCRIILFSDLWSMNRDRLWHRLTHRLIRKIRIKM